MSDRRQIAVTGPPIPGDQALGQRIPEHPREEDPLPGTPEECAAEMERLAESINSISLQLAHSQAACARGEKKPDWDWIGRARYAKDMMKLRRNRLNLRIGELKRAARASAHEAFMTDRDKYRESTDGIAPSNFMAREFMAAAMRLFHPDDLLEVWEEVWRANPDLRPKSQRIIN